MTRLFFGLALLILALAQTTIMPVINVLEIGPNLVLVLLLLWSARRGAAEGLLWAFPIGIFLDLLALDPLGSNSVSLLPVALIGGLAQRRPLHSGVIIPMVAVLLATLAHQFVVMMLDAVSGARYGLLISLRLGLLTAMLNMAVVPILYLGMLILERVGVVRAARA